jgi:hypothetical protein
MPIGSLRYPTSQGVTERWWTYNPGLATLAEEAFFQPGLMSGAAALSVGGAGALGGRATLVGTAPITFGLAGTIRTGGSLRPPGPTGITFTAGGVLGARAGMLGTGALGLSGAGALGARVAMTGIAAASFGAEGGLALGLPPRITGAFNDRWMSGLQIGAARPTQRVQIRTGRFNRRHATWSGPDMDGITIHFSDADHDAGIDNNHPWQAFWEPDSAYVDVPNVRTVQLEQSLDQNGITAATITIDNVFYRPEPAGHHSIKRGYMAPLRGDVAPGRDELVDEQGETVVANEWFGLLFREAQITVHQAYGDQEVKTFTGLIDDVDTTSRPDVITITARDFGKVLADERVFGWNKEPVIKDPVVFIDDDDADNITLVGHDAFASSEVDPSITTRPGDDFEAANVLDGDGDTSWVSDLHTIRGVTEYVQIRLPEGRYNDFRITWPDAGGSDMDMYVSLLPKTLKNGDPPAWGNPALGGTLLTPDRWVSGDGSGDDVPGANGGHNFLRLIEGTPLGGPHTYALVPGSLDDFRVGKESILRVSFRNLGVMSLTTGASIYAADVTALKGRQRLLTEEAKTQKFIRVHDASDVVMQVLRWAGFKEWEVETAGVSLSKRFNVNRGMVYMDVITKMAEVLGYTFFMKDPSAAAESIGVPVFRRSLIVTGDPGVPLGGDGDPIPISDRTLLTGIDVKQSDESLAYIIRVRGRASANGQRLGGDSSKRMMYTYRPPWSGRRLGGVLKHVIHTDDMLRTGDDVKFGAFFIALQEALASAQASAQITAHPGIQIDDHVILADLGTGVSGRLSVQSRSSTFERSGEKTNWTMALGGALVDTQDVSDMVHKINTAKRA